MNNSTKLEVSLFKTALAYVGVDVDDEEVECMLANMIYKVKNPFGPHRNKEESMLCEMILTKFVAI